MQNGKLHIMVKYDNYYIDKTQYELAYSIIDDINILQPIKKLKTYEFISYKGVIMYKLDNNVIDKLKKLNYDIKYIYDFENCNDILYEKQKNTVN